MVLIFLWIFFIFTDISIIIVLKDTFLPTSTLTLKKDFDYHEIPILTIHNALYGSYFGFFKKQQYALE